MSEAVRYAGRIHASAQASAPAQTSGSARAEQQHPEVLFRALLSPTPEMGSSQRHGPGPRRRFYRQLREAALRADGTEALILEALEAALRAGDLCVFEASDRVRVMLREQHARATTEQQAA